MTKEQKEILIQKVKTKCYITDDSDLTNDRLGDIVDDAVVEITRLIGIKGEFDFSQAGQERGLLLNYCFYVWNDAEADFKPNYKDHILALRQKHEVLNYEKEVE